MDVSIADLGCWSSDSFSTSRIRQKIIISKWIFSGAGNCSWQKIQFCEWSRALYAGLCKAMMAGVSSVCVSWERYEGSSWFADCSFFFFFLGCIFMIRLENWQLVNFVCTWRNFLKFLNFFLLLVEDGFQDFVVLRYEGIPWLVGWLAGWSFFFLLFFSWLRLHGSSRENLADHGFGLWRCILTASFLSFLV